LVQVCRPLCLFSLFSSDHAFRAVVVVAKFHDQDDLIKLANDTLYGLAAAVFSNDITKAISTANALHAGTVWINCFNIIDSNVPFGGYKRTCYLLFLPTS
jgi:aldehyde dehydrogenase (NAD+)